MPEKFHRTSEGLSLVDPFIDVGLIADSFPNIITAYSQLPISLDKNPDAVRLMKRRYTLEKKQIGDTLTPLERLILETDLAADAAVNSAQGINGYKPAISIYKLAFGKIDQLKLEETDQQLARMWFFERISHHFHQIGMDEKESTTKDLVQSVIACMYSDLELGARETTLSRGRHALATATRGFSLFGDKGLLMAEVLTGRRERLPDDYWDEQIQQKIRQMLAK